MKLIKWAAVAGAVLVAALVCNRAFAASALPVLLQDVMAFRHVLETNDMLFLGRYQLTPASQTAIDDFTTINVEADGDLSVPLVLTNRHTLQTYTSITVVETSPGTTAVTNFCSLGTDRQTITCLATGLSLGNHNFRVNYLNGWDAYSGADVSFRLFNQAATLQSERTVPQTGYALVGLYRTAAQAASITWGSTSVQVHLLGSPSLWGVGAPPRTSVTTWRATADNSATQTQLTSDLKDVLRKLEIDDGAIAPGDYVGSQYITDAGLKVAAAAFSAIGQAVPTAFLTSSINQAQNFTPRPQSLAANIQATATASQYGAAPARVGSQFGVSAHTVGGLFTLILAFIVALMVWRLTIQRSGQTGSSAALSAMAAVMVLMSGWLIGWVPTAWIAFPAAILGALGVGWIVLDRIMR